MYYNIVRAQRDVGGESRIGVAYTDRIAGDDYNRVADVDGRMLFGKVYTGTFQYARSFDQHVAAQFRAAPLWDASLNRNGREFGFRYSLNGIDDNFRAPTGFISRGAIAHGAIDHRGTWFNTRGSLVETLTGDMLYDDIWEYSHFMRRGDAQDKKFHVDDDARACAAAGDCSPRCTGNRSAGTRPCTRTTRSSGPSARRSTRFRSRAWGAFRIATTSPR